MGTGIDHNAIKEEISKEYIVRMRKLLESQLGSKNKLQAIGALAVPALEYSFGIID